MERTFKKDHRSLEEVFAFIGECMSMYAVDADAGAAVSVAVEEFFTNMVKYSPEGKHDIALRISREGNTLRVSLVDTDVERFDVTKVPEAETGAPLEERRTGGLGIHIARHMIDSIGYEYADRCSTITLLKNLEK